MYAIRSYYVLAGIACDVESGETFFNVEAERRLGEDIAVELRARGFSGARAGDPTFAVTRDDYIRNNFV